MITEQETVTHYSSFILQTTYLHDLSPYTSSQPITIIIHLSTATLSINQSHRSPEIVNFQLTKTITWLWRWLLHFLSKCQSQTTVLIRTPITQMIFFQSRYFTPEFKPFSYAVIIIVHRSVGKRKKIHFLLLFSLPLTFFQNGGLTWKASVKCGHRIKHLLWRIIELTFSQS